MQSFTGNEFCEGAFTRKNKKVKSRKLFDDESFPIGRVYFPDKWVCVNIVGGVCVCVLKGSDKSVGTFRLVREGG